MQAAGGYMMPVGKDPMGNILHIDLFFFLCVFKIFFYISNCPVPTSEEETAF